MSQKDERKLEVTPTASHTTPPEKKKKTEEPLAHLPLPTSNLLVCFNCLHKIKKVKEYRNKKNKTSSVPPPPPQPIQWQKNALVAHIQRICYLIVSNWILTSCQLQMVT